MFFLPMMVSASTILKHKKRVRLWDLKFTLFDEGDPYENCCTQRN